MAVVVSYDVPTNTITVTGGTEGTPADFADIQAANDGGGWGVITNPCTNVYCVSANLDIGDGATPTYFLSKDEMIHFSTDCDLDVKANATLCTGEKQSDEYGIRGSLFYFESDSATTGVIDLLGTVKSYNSRWQCFDYTDVLLKNKFWKFSNADTEIIDSKFVGFKAIRISDSGQSWKNVCFYKLVILHFTAAATLNAMKLYKAHNGIYLTSPPVGLIIRDIDEIGGTTNLAMGTIDNDVDMIDCSYGAVILGPTDGTESVYDKKSCNIHIADKDGIDLAGVTVLCEDKDGNEVFSVNTDANGDIAEQTISYKRYYYDGGAQVETLSPHKFTISKAGYETLVLENVTVDEPINWWHLELLPALAESDVRDAVDFGEDKTGSLDLPTEDDVEDGVKFDNDTKEGNFEAPAEEDVEVGVKYGANGAEFEGTYLGLKGNNLTAVLEKSVSLVGHLEKKVTLTGELKS